jgi:hypothetical protein
MIEILNKYLTPFYYRMGSKTANFGLKIVVGKSIRKMTKGSSIVKFRETGNEKELIKIATERLGLNNESATIRILLQLGLKEIDSLLEHAWSVSHPLKYSEIDYLTSSLNLYLKERKRKLAQKTGTINSK